MRYATNLHWVCFANGNKSDKQSVAFNVRVYNILPAQVFVTLSTHSQTYGEGVEISKDRFASKHGVNLFYYDETAIKAQFSDYGLLEVKKVNEYSQKFWLIVCKKGVEVQKSTN